MPVVAPSPHHCPLTSFTASLIYLWYMTCPFPFLLQPVPLLLSFHFLYSYLILFTPVLTTSSSSSSLTFFTTRTNRNEQDLRSSFTIFIGNKQPVVPPFSAVPISLHNTMAAVVKRTPSSSRLKSSPSFSSTTTTTNTNNPRRPSTRASDAASTEAMSLTIEASASAQDGRMLTPPPMSARSELSYRLGEVSMNSPVAERRGSPAAASVATSHNSAAGAANGTTSLFAQNRAMLLSGLPRGDFPQPPSPLTQGIQRRDSGNGSLMANRRLTPLVTVTESVTQPLRYPLSARPHLGSVGSPIALSPRTISPCVYVKGVGLRRSSAVSVSDGKDVKAEKTEKTEKLEKAGRKTSSASSTTSTDPLLSTPPPEGRLVVSARITPANAEKQPFTLQREFDLQELVEALPRPDHRRPSTVNILASPTVYSPHASPNAFASTSTGTGTGKKRSAPDNTPASPHPSFRRQTRQANQQQQQKKQLTPVKELPSPSQFVANGRLPIPIRMLISYSIVNYITQSNQQAPTHLSDAFLALRLSSCPGASRPATRLRSPCLTPRRGP